MTTIGVVNEGAVENALIPYGNAWLKEKHPQYPKTTVYWGRSGEQRRTENGHHLRDAEIDRKAAEIVKTVAGQQKVDLVLKMSAVAHIANSLVDLTDECIAEAKKLA